jgi:hypothetical protein
MEATMHDRIQPSTPAPAANDVHAFGPFLALAGTALLVAALLAALAGWTARSAEAAVVPLATLVVPAPEGIQPAPWCDELRSGGAAHCEVRSFTAPLLGGSFAVEGVTNGSIRVEAWSGSDVRVTARIHASNAGTPSRARELVDGVSLDSSGGGLRVSGPRSGFLSRGNWNVDLRIQLPEAAAARLSTTNGAIRVEGIRGGVDARTTNGTVTLAEVGGTVNARATNGNVSVAFSSAPGASRPDRIELRTTNGTVDLALPADASARVTARTTNGSVTSDFPLDFEGQRRNRASGTIGDGSVAVTLQTTNGSVRIRRHEG